MLTIQQAGQKAAAIVQDLRTLARRGVADFDVVDLNRVVSDYLQSPEYEKMMQFHPAVAVDCDLAANLMRIKGSPVHLLKTVMNLVSNAAEAMPDGGTIHIQTENRYLDGPVGGYETVQEGEYVILTIADGGIGMTPTDLERIFEPFYSKKVMGKSGTGLGMAVVWGTVKDHHGYIDAHSREGAGTTFTLYFPATREAIKTPSDRRLLADLAGNGQSILIVDDVAEQRDMASAMLSRLGYRVQAVASGEAAVDHVVAQPVDLLLLDMIMDPGIDGLETYRRICAIHSGQKAVIASGYAETECVRRLQQLGPIPYLKKPYRLETLAEIVKATLQAA
jgi:CheY-like chemotaxis protein